MTKNAVSLTRMTRRNIWEEAEGLVECAFVCACMCRFVSLSLSAESQHSTCTIAAHAPPICIIPPSQIQTDARQPIDRKEKKRKKKPQLRKLLSYRGLIRKAPRLHTASVTSSLTSTALFFFFHLFPCVSNLSCTFAKEPSGCRSRFLLSPLPHADSYL